MHLMPLCVGALRNRQAISRLWRLNNRFVILQAVFYMNQHCCGVQKTPKGVEHMDTIHHKTVPDIGDLERKADELIHLMLSLCEERLNKIAMPDAHALSLASAAMSARYAVLAFLALARIN
jgi:hypothetical protein